MNQIQRFVRQFVSDEEFRRLALTNPAAALQGYELSAAERRSLVRLCDRVTSSGALIASPADYWF